MSHLNDDDGRYHFILIFLFGVKIELLSFPCRLFRVPGAVRSPGVDLPTLNTRPENGAVHFGASTGGAGAAAGGGVCVPVARGTQRRVWRCSGRKPVSAA